MDVYIFWFHVLSGYLPERAVAHGRSHENPRSDTFLNRFLNRLLLVVVLRNDYW